MDFAKETNELINNTFRKCRICGKRYTDKGIIRHYRINHRKEFNDFLFIKRD